MPKRVLIVGYGTAGRSLATSLKKHDQLVVGFLDDKSAHNSVLGKLADVNQIINAHNITDVYFAIPTASAKVVRDFINTIENDRVEISIIPRSFSIIAKNTVSINDLTDVNILALIGRQPVKHDLLECRKLVEGKIVAVTGADRHGTEAAQAARKAI